MLGAVITIIVRTFVPKCVKLPLILSIPQPMITHVPCLGAFLVNVIIDKTRSGGIVCFYRGGWLGMAQGGEKLSDWERDTSVVVDSCDLSLGGRAAIIETARHSWVQQHCLAEPAHGQRRLSDP